MDATDLGTTHIFTITRHCKAVGDSLATEDAGKDPTVEWRDHERVEVFQGYVMPNDLWSANCTARLQGSNTQYKAKKWGFRVAM